MDKDERERIARLEITADIRGRDIQVVELYHVLNLLKEKNDAIEQLEKKLEKAES